MPKIVELLRSETARPEKATPASSRICSAACEHVELSCATRANHSDTRTIGVYALWEGLMTSHLLIFRPLYVRIVQLSRGTRAAGYLTMSLNYVRFCWWAGSIVAAVYFLYRGKSGVRPFSMPVLFFKDDPFSQKAGEHNILQAKIEHFHHFHS